MYTTFLLGELEISEKALAALGRTPLDLIARHAVREHGHATPHELLANSKAVERGGQVISRYRIDPTDPARGSVVVITRRGGAQTVVCLESEARFKETSCSRSS